MTGKRFRLVLMILALVLPAAAGCAKGEEDPARLAVNLQAIKAMLDQNEVVYTYHASADCFDSRFDLNGEKMKQMTAWIAAYDDGVEIQADYTVNLPPETWAVEEVSVFLILVNYDLRMGGFYMNPEKGIIGYKVFLYTDSMAPTQEMLRFALALSIHETEALGDLIYEVLQGSATAAEAYARYTEER